MVFCFIDLIDLFGFSELCGPTPRKRCRTRGAHLGEGRTRMRGESHFRVMNSSARQETAMGSNDLLFKNFDHLKKTTFIARLKRQTNLSDEDWCIPKFSHQAD